MRRQPSPLDTRLPHLAAAISSRLRSGQPGWAAWLLLSATARYTVLLPLPLPLLSPPPPSACCCSRRHSVSGAVATRLSSLATTSHAGAPLSAATWLLHASATAAAALPSAACKLTGGAASVKGVGG